MYKVNPEFIKLFEKLDSLCISSEHDNPCDNSFEYMNVVKSFVPQLKQIFNILNISYNQGDIYIPDISLGQHKPCVYYKYWFYHKIINHKIEEIDIKELYQVWNQNTNIIYGLNPDRCKFHAKSLDDVKILKVLYDYALFFNNAEYKYNILNEIKNCQFCKFLKSYLDNTFNNRSISCTNISSDALCMEYNEFLKSFFKFNEISSLLCEYNVETSHSNKCQQLYEKVIKHNNPVIATDDIVTRDENGPSTSTTIMDNPQGNNSNKRCIIGGTAILGLSCTLFFLYKVYIDTF